jgi:hypothetical protein
MGKLDHSSMYLFSRNVLALDTFFPMADAFQEKYDPEGSTWIEEQKKGTQHFINTKWWYKNNKIANVNDIIRGPIM